MNYENAKPLLRITNLKQYFPLKRGLSVKANDGITLDIYEGVRSRHSVGVPLFQLEDGTYTLDSKKAFASVGIDAELSYKN